ncbi:hypothetical protein T265_10966 [Opisthorchis viverrini]|uniref:Uncharacterized protein n=1 Tax=Opisthorchis viverrini TaxID=6198 RepID=A0A074Z0L5_OPIVI|nr:hypothetical protein T265_10966 [Opisthorchis viverrini]KER20498.1 hypothetical protein T265_10966 [Opisthorchis viverrini]
MQLAGPIKVHQRQMARWSDWLEREFTDNEVHGSKPTSATRLPLSRLGQPGTIPALVQPSGGTAARHRKGATAERLLLLLLLLLLPKVGKNKFAAPNLFEFLNRNKASNRFPLLNKSQGLQGPFHAFPQYSLPILQTRTFHIILLYLRDIYFSENEPFGSATIIITSWRQHPALSASERKFSGQTVPKHPRIQKGES